MRLRVDSLVAMPRRRRPHERSLPRSDPFPVDVSDRGEEFLVAADLPGLRTQAIDVSVRKDRLRIAADFGDEAGDVGASDSGTYLRRERPRGEVARVVRLPERVDEERVTASYDPDGVLRIVLRKRDRPKRVPVE